METNSGMTNAISNNSTFSSAMASHNGHTGNVTSASKYSRRAPSR